jgi:outer membrane protein OmpA-like peptidoglycan-associated protein
MEVVSCGFVPWREGVAVSRSLSRWQALVLGVVVLLGLALAVAGVFAVGSRGWYGSDALHVRAGFREIKGVEVGTRVRIRGIDAGEVVGVELPDEEEAPVILRLRIKGKHRNSVKGGSTVVIVNEGMLGGKVVEIRPPARIAGAAAPDTRPAAEDALLASAESAELTDVLGSVGDALAGLKKGEGTLGKLAKDPQAYDALVDLLKSSRKTVEQGQDTIDSIRRDADALKKVPILGRYVERSAQDLLVRQQMERNRKIFAEAELFEPGRAVLTSQGRRRLDEIAPWLTGLKHKGSEVVVVSYADRGAADPQAALSVTRQQSEAVVEYLKKQHTTHKLGWLSSRKVIALGQGTQPPPLAEKDPLPAARVEVVVFVPQG